MRNGIARFGVPDTITSDQGKQFSSGLWAASQRASLLITSSRPTFHLQTILPNIPKSDNSHAPPPQAPHTF
ncbi:hypothetical protein PoB_006132800 [Plakobranchus ocellatus]|uniref:Integrase catalytic domain-containing protein n=1 Tax=Plakobranchus ocellatus TaxID=259542 RepID=A0AAV4CSG5_9GAST|nr:hypothetical protein PoB_006132800 [Plakobranchus ocellatus]